MADLKFYDVIERPVITENSMSVLDEKKYTFIVHPEATKAQIKDAVEKMFEGAKVASVNTMNYDGKPKSDWLESKLACSENQAFISRTV